MTGKLGGGDHPDKLGDVDMFGKNVFAANVVLESVLPAVHVATESAAELDLEVDGVLAVSGPRAPFSVLVRHPADRYSWLCQPRTISAFPVLSTMVFCMPRTTFRHFS